MKLILALIVIGIAIYMLVNNAVNEIKKHITKEADKIIAQTNAKSHSNE
jgi:hypothetical protein